MCIVLATEICYNKDGIVLEVCNLQGQLVLLSSLLANQDYIYWSLSSFGVSEKLFGRYYYVENLTFLFSCYARDNRFWFRRHSQIQWLEDHNSIFILIYRFSWDQFPRSWSSSSELCRDTVTSTTSRSLTTRELERSLLTWTEDSTRPVSSHQDSTWNWRISRSSFTKSSHPDNLDSSFWPPTRVSWTTSRPDRTISVVRSSDSSTETSLLTRIITKPLTKTYLLIKFVRQHRNAPPQFINEYHILIKLTSLSNFL